jgi:hypothetical protein
MSECSLNACRVSLQHRLMDLTTRSIHRCVGRRQARRRSSWRAWGHESNTTSVNSRPTSPLRTSTTTTVERSSLPLASPLVLWTHLTIPHNPYSHPSNPTSRRSWWSSATVRAPSFCEDDWPHSLSFWLSKAAAGKHVCS